MKKICILITIMILANLAAIGAADDNLPVKNGVVTSGVGLRLDPFGSGKLVFHRGIDIAVPVGTPVHAVRKGRVIFAGERRGYGFAVIVEHSNGDRTMYGHNSLLRVSPGEMVEAGTVLALSGNTGRSTGPHVHYELMPSGRPVTARQEKEEIAVKQVAGDNARRSRYEQQINETVNSILRTIKEGDLSGRSG